MAAASVTRPKSRSASSSPRVPDVEDQLRQLQPNEFAARHLKELSPFAQHLVAAALRPDPIRMSEIRGLAQKFGIHKIHDVYNDINTLITNPQSYQPTPNYYRMLRSLFLFCKRYIYTHEAIEKGAFDALMGRLILRMISLVYDINDNLPAVVECVRAMDSCRDVHIAAIVCALAGRTQTMPIVTKIFAMRSFPLSLETIQQLIAGFPQGIPETTAAPAPKFKTRSNFDGHTETLVPTNRVDRTMSSVESVMRMLRSLDIDQRTAVAQMLVDPSPERAAFYKRVERMIQKSFVPTEPPGARTIGPDVPRYISKWL